MNQIYTAKNYFEEILLGSNSNGIGFINESLHAHTYKGQLGYNRSRNYSDEVVSVGLLQNNMLEIGIDQSVLTSHLCGCVKNDVCRKLMLNSSFVTIVPKTKYKPHLQLSPGSRIGHANLAANSGYGSLGGFIIPRVNNGNLYAVSNNHVLADTNNGRPGDPVYHMGLLPNRIGRLLNYVPISSTGVNKLDVAVAELENFTFNNPPSFAKCRPAKIGERVYKQGASTGLTYGVIRSLNYTSKINYGRFNAVFADQIQIAALNSVFSSPGDSGSIIKAGSDHAHVGLLFGGNDTYTMANHQTDVATKLSEWGYLK